jgi:hypothetical protein
MLSAERPEFESRQERSFIFCPTTAKLTPRFTEAPCSGKKGLSSRAKRPEHEADSSLTLTF